MIDLLNVLITVGWIIIFFFKFALDIYSVFHTNFTLKLYTTKSHHQYHIYRIKWKQTSSHWRGLVFGCCMAFDVGGIDYTGGGSRDAEIGRVEAGPYRVRKLG